MDQDNLKHKTKVAFYWNTIQNFSVQALSFVFSIILARLLSPSDFGILAMPAVFIALSNVFINSGFNSALVRKPDLTEEDLSTAFYFNGLMGLLCSAVLFLCSPAIANFYNQPILADTLKVSSITIFLGAFQSVHYVHFNRNLDFKTPAKIYVISTLLSGIFGIVLAYSGFGIWALVLQGVANLFVTMALVWYYSKWRPKAKWSNASFRYLWNYGGKVLFSGVIDTLHDNIYPIVIGKFYSATALGLYNRASGYAQLPHKQVCGIVDGVSFPVLSKFVNDQEQMVRYFERLLKNVIFIVCPLLLGMSALSEPLIIVMITEKWIDCVPLLSLLCFPVIFWPIQSLNFNLIKVIGRTDILLKLNIYIKTVGIAIIATIIVFFLDKGVYVIAWGGIIHIIFVMPVITYVSGRLTGFGMRKQFSAIFPILVLGAVMYFMVIIAASFFDNNSLKLLVGFVVGVVVYVSGAYLFKFSQLDDVIYMLKRKL